MSCEDAKGFCEDAYIADECQKTCGFCQADGGQQQEQQQDNFQGDAQGDGQETGGHGDCVDTFDEAGLSCEDVKDWCEDADVADECQKTCGFCQADGGQQQEQQQDNFQGDAQGDGQALPPFNGDCMSIWEERGCQEPDCQ